MAPDRRKQLQDLEAKKEEKVRLDHGTFDSLLECQMVGGISLGLSFSPHVCLVSAGTFRRWLTAVRFVCIDIDAICSLTGIQTIAEPAGRAAGIARATRNQFRR